MCVFGTVGGSERQLLRFDCFEKDPHYHYDPDGRDEVLHLDATSDTVSWAAHHIERNLAVMIRLAGYPDLQMEDFDAALLYAAQILDGGRPVAAE